MLDVHFARGIGVEELPLRMGAPPGVRAEPMTDVEERFGLSLPRSVLAEAPLPVYAIMGSPAPDFEAISAWAAANGKPLPDPHLRLIPAGLRNDYERATDPQWWERRTRPLTGGVGLGGLHTLAVLKNPEGETER